MKIKNPFSQSRFEWEENPIIWVSNTVKGLFLDQRPAYIQGVRGTGKTSILKALDSRERSRNGTLRAQLTDESKQWAGIYLKIPSSFSNALVDIGRNYRGIKNISKDLFQLRLFEYFLSLQCADLLIRSIKQSDGVESAERSLSREKEIGEHFREVLKIQTEGRSASEAILESLCLDIGKLRRDILAELTLGNKIALETILRSESFAIVIRALFNKIKMEFGPSCTSLRICIDECETLNPIHKIVLNTLIRQAEFPITYCIAYISGFFDPITTLSAAQYLGSEDRCIIDLNELDEDTEFAPFCQTVASMRVLYSLSEEKRAPLLSPNAKTKPDLNLTRLLGHYSLNELVVNAKRGALAIEYHALENRAAEVRQFLDARRPSDETLKNLEINDDKPPILIAYLLEKLGRTLPSDPSNATQVESFFASIRKPMRAAFLAFSNQFRIETLPLAGRRIVIALSDLSIRDFLDIMAAFIDARSPRGLTEDSLLLLFSEPHASKLKTQRQAILEASEKKMTDAIKLTGPNGTEVIRLVRALALLAAEIQGNPNSQTTFTRPERGWFVYRPTPIRRDDAKRVIAAIHSARSLGLVRSPGREEGDLTALLNTEKNALVFRLHRRLSPAFRFSHRATLPNARVDLPYDALEELISISDSQGVTDWVKRTYKKIEPSDADGPFQTSLQF